MEKRFPKVGDCVIFHNQKGESTNALITAVWGSEGQPLLPAVNLVTVSPDPDRKDGYGRQIERPSSVCHGSVNQVHGYYWRYADETPNPYVTPAA